MMLRSVAYGFPTVILAPGAQESISVSLKDWFRPTKLMFFATMKEVRGYYRVKRSRRPALDREYVVSYSRIHKWRNKSGSGFRPGKTVVEYSAPDGSSFAVAVDVREYLPSSVLYFNEEALSYIRLVNVFCNREPAMPTGSEGVSAMMFTPNRLDNGLPLPSANHNLTLVLKKRR